MFFEFAQDALSSSGSLYWLQSVLCSPALGVCVYHSQHISPASQAGTQCRVCVWGSGGGGGGEEGDVPWVIRLGVLTWCFSLQGWCPGVLLHLPGHLLGHCPVSFWVHLLLCIEEAKMPQLWSSLYLKGTTHPVFLHSAIFSNVNVVYNSFI